MIAEIDTAALRRLLKALDRLCNDVILDVSPEGITINAMDGAVTSILNVTLPATACKRYVAETDRIGIDLSQMIKTVDAFSSDTVTLSVSEGAITLLGGGYVFSARSIDPVTVKSGKEIPDKLTWPMAFVIPGKILHEVTKALGKVGDVIIIESFEDSRSVCFYAEGSTSGLSKEFREADAEITAETFVKASSRLSTDLVDAFTGTYKEFENVTMKISTNYPVLFEATDDIGVKYRGVIAPRISNDVDQQKPQEAAA